MIHFVRSLIREAVAQMAAPSPTARINPEKLYLDKSKAISLAKEIVQTHGYSNTRGDAGSFNRALAYVQQDPELTGLPIDQEFCAQFEKAVRGREPWQGKDVLFWSKLGSALHAPNFKFAYMTLLLGGMVTYLSSLSRAASKALDISDTLIAFPPMSLKQYFDPERTGQERPLYVFQDAEGTLYYKYGKPPSILMRKSQGKMKILALEPYKMRENDVYLFKGKVYKSYVSSRGHNVNVIDSLQPA